MAESAAIRYPSFSKKIIIIVGGFGSGKTEISVNLAKYLKKTTQTEITIVDLDLVNPYFRTREAIDEFDKLGIKAVAPRGGQFYADLPILLPEVKGAIENNTGILILDVGGDAQGSKALGSLSDVFLDESYEMLFVINSRRPQTADLKGCLETMTRIEKSSNLKFTGLIANSHMLEETDADLLLEGYKLADEIKEEINLPLVFLSAKEKLLNKIDLTRLNSPILPLTRSMLKPWERSESGERD